MSTHLALLAPIDVAETMLGFFAAGLAALTFVIHVLSAIAVYRDGHALRMRANAVQPGGPGTILLPPEIWALATLVMGIVLLAVYWFLHHSSIVARPGDEERRAFQPDVPPVG